MPLTAKALDRLLSRLVDRLVDRVPPTLLPQPPAGELTAAVTAAADRLILAHLAEMKDDGSLDHRVNDTIDLFVDRELRALPGGASEAVASAVATALPDLDELVSELVSESVSELVSERVSELVSESVSESVSDRVSERVRYIVDTQLASRYACTMAQAFSKVAQEVISTAVCRVEDAVVAHLEAPEAVS